MEITKSDETSNFYEIHMTSSPSCHAGFTEKESLLTPVTKILMGSQVENIYQSDSPSDTPSTPVIHYKAKVQDLEQKMGVLKKDYAALQATLLNEQEAKEKLEDKIEDNEHRLKTCGQQLTKNKKEIDELRQENDKMTWLKSENQVLLSKHETLQQQVTKLRDYEERFPILEADLKVESKRTAELETQLMSYQSDQEENARLNQSLVQLQATVSEYQQTCSSQEQHIKELLAEGKNTKKDYVILKEMFYAQKVEIRDGGTMRTPDVSFMQGEPMSVVTEFEVQELKEKIEELQSTWLTPDTANQLKLTIDSLQDQLHKEQERYSALLGDFEKHRIRLDVVEKENARLHTALVKTKDQFIAVLEQLNDLKTKAETVICDREELIQRINKNEQRNRSTGDGESKPSKTSCGVENMSESYVQEDDTTCEPTNSCPHATCQNGSFTEECVGANLKDLTKHCRQRINALFTILEKAESNFDSQRKILTQGVEELIDHQDAADPQLPVDPALLHIETAPTSTEQTIGRDEVRNKAVEESALNGHSQPSAGARHETVPGTVDVMKCKNTDDEELLPNQPSSHDTTYLIEYSTTVQQLQSEIECLNKKLENKQEKHEEQQNQLGQEAFQRETVIRSLQEKINQLLTDVQSIENKLKQSINDLQSTNQEFHHKCEELKAVKLQLGRAENALLQSKVERKISVENFEEQLSKHKKESEADLYQQKFEYETRMASLENQVLQLEVELEQYKKLNASSRLKVDINENGTNITPIKLFRSLSEDGLSTPTNKLDAGNKLKYPSDEWMNDSLEHFSNLQCSSVKKQSMKRPEGTKKTSLWPKTYTPLHTTLSTQTSLSQSCASIESSLLGVQQEQNYLAFSTGDVRGKSPRDLPSPSRSASRRVTICPSDFTHRRIGKLRLLDFPSLQEEPDEPNTSTALKKFSPKPSGTSSALKRVAELQRRNAQQLSHLKSSYPIETQGATPSKCDENVRTGKAEETMKRIKRQQEAPLTNRTPCISKNLHDLPGYRSLSKLPPEDEELNRPTSYAMKRKQETGGTSTNPCSALSPKNRRETLAVSNPSSSQTRKMGPEKSTHFSRRRNMMFEIQNTPPNPINRKRRNRKKSPSSNPPGCKVEQTSKRTLVERMKKPLGRLKK